MTVVMAVWNADRFLRPAMDSVLRQSFQSFELLVIDDGSSDGTSEVLRLYTDPRVQVVRNDARRGLVHSLNVGIGLARGEYVARMDGDDVSHPERLLAQVRFLDREKDVALVGTWARMIDEEGEFLGLIKDPTGSREIYESLLDRNVFVHSSVMFRKRAVLKAGGYQAVRADAWAAQDYHLWLRLADRYPLANLAQVLVDYRLHPGQVSTASRVVQRRCANLARRMAARRRTERGESPKALTGFRLMERLRGEPGSLGGDYLFLCYLYRTAERRNIALKLAWQAVLSSPLCWRAWDLAGRESIRRMVGPRGIKRLQTWLAKGR